MPFSDPKLILLSVRYGEMLAMEVHLSQKSNINLHNNLHWIYSEISSLPAIRYYIADFVLFFAGLVEQTTHN